MNWRSLRHKLQTDKSSAAEDRKKSNRLSCRYGSWMALWLKWIMAWNTCKQGQLFRNARDRFDHFSSFQFSTVAQSCPTLCNPMDCNTPGLPVHHQLPDFTQTHVHWVSDAIQPSHPLSSPSLPAFNLSHHQSLFKWVSSSHQVAKVLEFQLHQSFQWTFRTDLL